MNQKIKVGINGFGRIGRVVTRLALEHDTIEIAGINDLSKPEQMAHLLQYDSVHGTLKSSVKLEGNALHVGSKKIPLFSERDPSVLPWQSLGAQIVHECTGVFLEKEKASLHLKAGAKKVILSAPAKDPDITICMGVNQQQYQPKNHHILSNASCTTNCLAPVVKVLDDEFGVIRGVMLTVHSYTNDQNILDLAHKDPRRARAGALSQIPTTTGAAKAVAQVIPHLKGKLDGLAIRVPTPNVSLVDFSGELKKPATKETINTAFLQAAQGALQGILGVAQAPMVSIDFNGCRQSSTVDIALTHVIDETLVKVIAWYDNETGYSARMLDLTQFIAQKGY